MTIAVQNEAVAKTQVLPFRILKDVHVVERLNVDPKDVYCVSLKLEVDGLVLHDAGDGADCSTALYDAIRKMLARTYPKMCELELLDQTTVKRRGATSRATIHFWHNARQWHVQKTAPTSLEALCNALEEGIG